MPGRRADFRFSILDFGFSIERNWGLGGLTIRGDWEEVMIQPIEDWRLSTYPAFAGMTTLAPSSIYVHSEPFSHFILRTSHFTVLHPSNTIIAVMRATPPSPGAAG